MPSKCSISGLAVFLSLLVASGAALGQTSIGGITDKTVYTDRVTLRIPSTAGCSFKLDGVPVQTDVDIVVDQVDYHEITKDCPPQAPVLVRFIVKSSERLDSEKGLPPWVPYPMINSAAEEFAGAELTVVVPQRYPLGFEVPVVALVGKRTDDDTLGARVGVNGWVKAASFPDFKLHLLRGVGSAYLPAASAAGAVSYTAEVKTLGTPKQIDFEASTTWTSVSGTLSVNTAWPEDSRIHVTGSLTVAAGATLTIGAGSVIWLDSKVDIEVNGRIVVDGATDRPVVFTPLNKATPWGGFLFRSAPPAGQKNADIKGAILFGACANQNWFSANCPSPSCETHLQQQALVFVSGGAKVDLTDTYLLDCHGQAGHGESSYLNLTRCLYQRFLTGGEYNACVMNLTRCGIMEFPSADEPFADDDGDAIYFTGGGSINSVYTVTDCLIGWAHDDGIDSGSGTGGPVNVSGTWIESDYHEGLAWSSASAVRRAKVRDTVILNCGQGNEVGWNNGGSVSPEVDADRCLFSACAVGARFGDNYDWSYNGNMYVNDTLILYNRRNVWTRDWDDWLEHLDRIHLKAPTEIFPAGSANYISDPAAPANNFTWDPSIPDQMSKLERFLPTPPGSAVGIGIAVRSAQLDMAQLKTQLGDGVPVRLSTFTTLPVSVGYTVDSDAGPLGSGTLAFVPGETVKRIPIDYPGVESRNLIRVTLSSPVNAELTDLKVVTYVRLVTITLIPTKSRWKYLDTGVPQGTAWRAADFPDGTWKEDPAELGYGDDKDGRPEATVVSFGSDSLKKFPTTYFRKHFDVADPTAFTSLTVRLLRDDGGVVYINNREAFRSNMPEGIDINYDTLASGNTSSETAFFPKDIDPSYLESGSNVIAVEIHQNALDSSDISFDLELVGKAIPSIPTARFVRGDANGDGDLDISDAVKVLFFLFSVATSDCEDAMDANDLDGVNIADVVYILEYLFRDGQAPPAPFPAAGEDTTADGLEVCTRT